jgi:SAM-dependent methyltransferase
MAAPLSDLIRVYRDHVSKLCDKHPQEIAMARAVGGHFHAFGILMRQILLDAGLQDNNYLIDVGCGSGRLAHTLSVARYLGIDVVPDLLDYARSICPDPRWRFTLVESISIPEQDAVADMVCFFSVFTHLLHEDSYLYLLEAHRVLKPGGKAVFSFLEFRIANSWALFSEMVRSRAQAVERHHNQFMSREAIEVWAKHAGFHIEAIFDGDVPHTTLPEPMVLDDGRTISGRVSLGRQSVCILRKS